MQIFRGFFAEQNEILRLLKPLSHADSVCRRGECCSAKNAVPPARAFAFPIRKRTFLPEHILPMRVQQ